MGQFEQGQIATADRNAARKEPRDDAQSKLHDLLETMWEQRKGTILDRLSALEGAVNALPASPTRASRETGIDAAHKLAGILGTFGLPRGTDLAREAEVALSAEGPIGEALGLHLQGIVRQLAHLIANRNLPA